MDSNLFGLFISILLIFAVLLFAVILKKNTKIDKEVLRKIVHISVANWWFLLLILVDDLFYALMGPVCFILFNSLFVLFPKFGSLFGFEDRKRNMGLVYYPISLLIIVFLCYGGILPKMAGTIGIMCMGYGDGLAAIIGSRFGKRRVKWLKTNKTYLGSLSMALICFIVCFLSLYFTVNQSFLSILIKSLVVGVLASFIEIITPMGLDNLSVPLIITLVGGLL